MRRAGTVVRLCSSQDAVHLDEWEDARAARKGLRALPLWKGYPLDFEAEEAVMSLIKQVYEVDPLSCPKCGGEMKIIAFIERRQRAVVEKILRHCGLWEEESDRGPPQVQGRRAG